jgi:hypothetical protein
MASSKVEHVARAIYNVELNAEGELPVNDSDWRAIRTMRGILDRGRAAIEAMREPTEGMVMAMTLVVDPAEGDTLFEITEWKAAIDAALE